jgi:hypothetical protein
MLVVVNIELIQKAVFCVLRLWLVVSYFNLLFNSRLVYILAGYVVNAMLLSNAGVR